MRLKLRLESIGDRFLNLNYNYQLASSIYNVLRFGSPEFAAFLHDIGFELQGKKYKLFTFSLRFDEFKIIEDKIEFLSPHATLFISSPLVDDFIINFVIGSFDKQIITLRDKEIVTRFKIRYANPLPVPVFNNSSNFKLLTPLVLSKNKNFNGEEEQYYLRAEDTAEINAVLANNLINKYKLVHKKDLPGESMCLEWKRDYMERHKRVTKKITINKNGRYPIDVVGVQAPFRLTGNSELIKIGYECGFGEKNSMGFGMAEMLN